MKSAAVEKRPPAFTRLPEPNLLRKLAPWLLALAVYSTGVAFLDHEVLGDQMLGKRVHLTELMHVLLGSILGFLLVFRTNTAYDRWWEGRKLWGQLVNDSRNLAIKAASLPGVGLDEARQLGRLLVNFARALKEHLREGIQPRQLSLYQTVEMDAQPAHVPAHIALMARRQIARWRKEGRIDGYDELLLDPHARALMDICGACERIRKTPLSPSYRAFIRRVIGLYLLTSPWAMADNLGYWTVVPVAILGYFMLGLEAIAENVAEPFGRGEDDLLLDEICRGIEASVNEIVNDGAEDMAKN